MVYFIWKLLLGFFCLTLCEGQQQTSTEISASLEKIPHKQLTELQYELEPGSASLPEESNPTPTTTSQQHYRMFLKRKKRAILFPSGVKVCPDETFEQALLNYLKFFKLRVCQETVWEVFKIFWDRLPDQTEYQRWMRLCEGGTMTPFEIGTNFSRSEEHHKLVREKLDLSKQTGSSSEVTETPPAQDITSFQDAAANVPFPYEVPVESHTTMKILEQEEAVDNLDNEIVKLTEKPVKLTGEKMVEFTILLLGEEYNKELSDPSSESYQMFRAKFIAQMQNVFQHLPGYKTIIVQKLSPSLLDDRVGVEVHYAVIFDGDAEAISSATLDLMNLHSNKVEDTVLNDVEDNPTAVYTVSSFRDYIVEAIYKQTLLKNNTFVLDYDSLQLINVRNASTYLYNEWTTVTEKSTFPRPSTGDVDNALKAEWLPTAYSTISNILPFEDTSHDLTSRSQVALEAESPVVTEQISSRVDVVPGYEYSFTTTTPGFQQNTLFSSLETRAAAVTVTFGHMEPEEESGDNEMLTYDHPTVATLSPQDHMSKDILTSTENNVIATLTTLASEISSSDVTAAIATELPALSKSSFESAVFTNTESDGTPTVITSSTSDDRYENLKILIDEHLLPPNTDTERSTHAAEGSGSGSGPLGKDSKPWIRATLEPFTSLEAQFILTDTMEITKDNEEFKDHSTDQLITKQANTEDIEIMSVDQITRNLEQSDSSVPTEQLQNQHSTIEPSTELSPVLWTLETLNTELSMQGSEVIYEYSFTESNSLVESTLKYSIDTSSKAAPRETVYVPETQESPSQNSIILQSESELTNISFSNKIEPLKPYLPGHSLITSPAMSEEDMQTYIVSVKTTPVSVSSTDVRKEDVLVVAAASPTELFDNTLKTIPSAKMDLPFGVPDHPVPSESAISNIIPVIYKEGAVTKPQSEDKPLQSDDSIEPTGLLHSKVVTVTQEEDISMDVQNISVSIDHMSTVYFHPDMSAEERSMVAKNIHSTDLAGVIFSTHESGTNVSASARALLVFFSLRVTNMIFSEDLFNKNSPEYKALEQRFLELLVPYLQSNLTGFQNLEILNFRNGSIIVNSRMKFAKPVLRNATNAVYIILEDFCNTAYQTMNLAIDKYSLDVEAGDGADPCKFQACNEFSECLINKWSGEGECVCNPGYVSIDGLPCQSLCDLELEFCQNDGKCDIIPGQGAICRCRVGENWWYRGEHCEEYVSEPLVVGIAIASVAGFLLVASAIIFFLARTLRGQNTKGDSEDSVGRQSDSLSSIENAVKYNPMYESDTTGYSHYYKRYPQQSSASSTSPETSADFSSEEIRHIYENSELTKEEIQDRIRIIELYAKDRQFAEFVRQHQMSVDSVRKVNPTN
ncbi:interphotoreceptor matrix proteoglycan 2 [Spea bombifrons]|uniref:interphotoreceptor matrix proteoglycan 2 n=1 Tax=Spea bombifrons TaxID=233779 RepID=UPI00234B18CA|nr:interphotoreceptor matrix proteoglycan 2 [Spea bombifrons]